MKQKTTLKTWKRISTVPAYLIQGISDHGTYETYKVKEGEKELYGSDDLRISLELSGGHSLLIPCGSRLVMDEDGSINIEMLVKEVDCAEGP
jgi:hypothetical protein